MSLRGRVAVVTGGGSGIGAAICRRLAGEGAIVGVADRDGDAVEQIVGELDDAIAMILDVSVSQQVDHEFTRLAERFGRLDVVANVAGVDDPSVKAEVARLVSAGEPLDITSRMSDEAWRRTLTVNLDGTFFCMRAALRVMLPRGRGSIINMASAAGVSGVAGLPHYSASKAGVIGLTQSVAREVAGRGVRVNAIAPGAVDTPMAARTPAGVGPSIPIGRVAQPEEIAAVAAFLAGDESSYMTGATLNVNGGTITG